MRDAVVRFSGEIVNECVAPKEVPAYIAATERNIQRELLETEENYMCW